jgi:predicted transcriptional regulator
MAFMVLYPEELGPGRSPIYRTTEKGERALESHSAIEAIYS